MENAGRITFFIISYTLLVAQSSFTLMLVFRITETLHYSGLKQMKETFLLKKKWLRSC